MTRRLVLGLLAFPPHPVGLLQSPAAIPVLFDLLSTTTEVLIQASSEACLLDKRLGEHYMGEST
jgi:hypothetical protein